MKEQCENGMLFSEIKETEVKGESVVMILEKRKMNAYAKTRSMLSHLPLQVIKYLYTLLNTCLLLNKKEKKNK